MMKSVPQSGFATAFGTAFRPFFLAAAGLSLFAMLYWVLLFSGQVSASALSYFPPVIWHMHEMVYGFIGAVIAGFLLTAVSNWTARETLRGWPLALLFGIWLGARCLPFLGSGYGLEIAVLNVLFFSYLAIAIAIPIIRSANHRNLFTVLIVIILAISDAIVHANLLGVVSGVSLAKSSIVFAFYLQVLLTIIIAGRVFPMFSANGLGGIYTPRKHTWLEFACILSFVVFAALNVATSSGVRIAPPVFAGIALLVALLHAIRVLGWFHRKIWTKPLIWVLHLGYYFLILGVLLLGVSAYYAELRVPGIHAMLAGGLGLITTGMMARVSLGHTGRDIGKPNKMISLVFVLVALAAVFRVFLPLIAPTQYLPSIVISGLLWCIGFLVFLLIYFRVLVTSRADGKPG